MPGVSARLRPAAPPPRLMGNWRCAAAEAHPASACVSACYGDLGLALQESPRIDTRIDSPWRLDDDLLAPLRRRRIFSLKGPRCRWLTAQRGDAEHQVSRARPGGPWRPR